MLKLSRDTNGNKTLKYSPSSGNGFSVQTNGNLLLTHAMYTDDFNHHVAMDELRMYIKQHGTTKQKLSLGLTLVPITITLDKKLDWADMCPLSRSRSTCGALPSEGINTCPTWHDTNDYGYLAAPDNCPLLTGSVTVTLK